jgi:hypothetical protein
MAKLKKSVSINAPVEKVFGYIEDPTNRPELRLVLVIAPCYLYPVAHSI